jgi:hypothetical protein
MGRTAGRAVTAPAAAPARVSCWGELRAERKLPGVLRVLVDGQHAGAFWREGPVWHARHQARVLGQARETEHASADDALRAVLRSGFARRLGAVPHPRCCGVTGHAGQLGRGPRSSMASSPAAARGAVDRARPPPSARGSCTAKRSRMANSAAGRRALRRGPRQLGDRQAPGYQRAAPTERSREARAAHRRARPRGSCQAPGRQLALERHRARPADRAGQPSDRQAPGYRRTAPRSSTAPFWRYCLTPKRTMRTAIFQKRRI